MLLKQFYEGPLESVEVHSIWLSDVMNVISRQTIKSNNLYTFPMHSVDCQVHFRECIKGPNSCKEGTLIIGC